MKYDLFVSKRSRTCNVCRGGINKQECHFVQTEIVKDTPYPIKKNICKVCAKTITSQDFAEYIEKLRIDLANLAITRMRYVDSKQL